MTNFDFIVVFGWNLFTGFFYTCYNNGRDMWVILYFIGIETIKPVDSAKKQFTVCRFVRSILIELKCLEADLESIISEFPGIGSKP